MKYYILNIVVVVVFTGFYFLTMTLDNDLLYLGIEDIWINISKNNKLPFHGLTYLYILPLVCLLVYSLQRYKYKDHLKSIFIVASFLSLAVTYLTCYVIFNVIDSNVWNLYYYPRNGAPVKFSIIVNIIVIIIGIPLCDRLIKQIKRNKLKR